MRILMLTAEYAPYAKTGGLADMVAGLSDSLKAAGHDVRVLMPAYRGLRGNTADALLDTAITTGDPQISPVALAGTHPGYRFCQAATNPTQPLIYLLDAPEFFTGTGLYGGGDLEARRFALLGHGALRLCTVLDWSPDILHCHDWHAGLAPRLLREGYREVPALRDARTILTLHNIGYQGVFARELAPELGLMGELPTANLNFLRTGIENADGLTTVSPSHALEILTPEYGQGLDGLLRDRSDRLIGILNGVDYRAWDPATDACLPAGYSSAASAGKALCRAVLRREAGLEANPALPLLGMVSRLAGQKGLDLLLEALPRYLESGEVQAVVLGQGEERYAAGLTALARRHPGLFHFIDAQDEALARRILAGSDAFLVPSLYEPCGLTQLYALRYGSVPVVRATGGLRDTVAHFDPVAGTGTGSVFWDADGNGLAWAIGQILAWWQEPDHWSRVASNGMAADFSWQHQTPHYVAAYRRFASGA